MNWYEENIEEPIRDVVKHLRDNGFNTECSCGHEMSIQIGHSLDGELMRLHSLLFGYFAEKKENEEKTEKNQDDNEQRARERPV